MALMEATISLAADGASAEKNPFSLPPEDQIFWLRDLERRKKAQEKEAGLFLKAHEKTTASSRINTIKAIKDEDLPMAPLPPPKEGSKTPGRAVKSAPASEKTGDLPDGTFLTGVGTTGAPGLDMQKGSVALRREEKDVRNFVRKKREMFLVQMALDVKRAEILKLDEKARMKEEALKKSQAMLDEDVTRFDTFLQGNDAKAHKSMKYAESMTKRKQEKLQRIKQCRQQIAGVRSEIAKYREQRDECIRYRQFLEKLTPVEWRDRQSRLKKERKAARKQMWVDERHQAVLDRMQAEERKDEQAFWEEVEMQHDAKRGGKGASSRRKKVGAGAASQPGPADMTEEERKEKEKELNTRKKKIRRKYQTKEQIEKEYQEESSEEEPEMYFKTPKQLMDIFTELEEKNLFLIQNSQETEQALEEVQQTFENTKKVMGEKARQLKRSIRQLETSIESEKKRCEELRKSYEEKAGTSTQDARLSELSQKVEKVYLACNFDADHDPDTLQMLGAIESKLEELVAHVDELVDRTEAGEEVVMRLERDRERERRERHRNERVKELTRKQEERLKNSLLRSQAPVHKKAGKQVMYRSPPLRQERKVVVDTSEQEANERDHRIFGVFIDKKDDMPKTELPEPDDPRKRSGLRGRTSSNGLGSQKSRQAEEAKARDEATAIGSPEESMEEA